MKKVFLLALILPAFCLLQACSGTDNNDSQADADSTAAAKDTLNKIAVPADKGDVQFAAEAASNGLTEIELGKLAIKNGQNPRVKNFGAMIAKDHAKNNNKLITLAKAKNITLPTKPNTDGQKLIDELSAKTGKDFDKAYIADMMANHQKDIKTFDYASKNCSDKDIKSYAGKTLPMLKNHLEAITLVHGMVK